MRFFERSKYAYVKPPKLKDGISFDAKSRCLFAHSQGYGPLGSLFDYPLDTEL